MVGVLVPTQRGAWRAAILVALCGVALTHVLATTFAAVPPNPASAALAPSTAYLSPYFAQNWRLFAPNPISEDRTVRFQAAYRDEAGDVQQTRWVDWTAVELDLVRHRLVGGRGGYVTNKLVDALGASYRPMTDAQRAVMNSTRDDAPSSWENLVDRLATAGVPPTRLQTFLRHERATVRLATDVVAARNPDADIVAVRYAVKQHSVTPYDRRGDSARENAASRPNSLERLSGWRVPVEGSVAERRAVADFDARHR